MVGGNEGLESFETARQGIRDFVTDAIGKTMIKETAALIERRRLFIGNDSVLVHMSAAMGFPLLLSLVRPMKARNGHLKQHRLR